MKKLFVLLLALMLCVPAAMAESSVYFIDGRSADRVHLRAEPSVQAESLGLYFTGTSVIVIETTDDWAWVMAGDVTGYMMSDFLTTSQPVQQGPWYIVDNPDSIWVNLRMSPSTEGMVAMCPDNGTAVRILGETADGWSYVECQGVKGYMMTSLLSPMYEAESAQRTTVLAQMGDWDDYIHQYIAPNGQALYFTAARRDPDVSFEDVNFDGWDDIVVMTTLGASNAYYDFFVYDAVADEYRLVSIPGEENGLCNYAFYPEYGIVATYANNGSAGACHEYCLYRWNGMELELIRSAISDNLVVTESTQQTYTTTLYHDILHIAVRNHELGDYDSSVVWEQTISFEDTEYRDIFNEEMDALWQGIR